jgi:hypothetical protein
MRNPQAIFLLAAALSLALPVAASAPAVDLAALFPDLDGWTKDGAPEAFLPENLYEHIDGAAENFLAYGFQQLAVQNYADRQKRALSAEIYFHGTAENAFGIYGSEKPLAGDYLRIGGQGYYEEGVLNFISDAYYVKLNGFDLGVEGREILLGLAGRIAAAIHGTNLLPETLDAFPASGRVAHSERFIAGHFLGQDFLGSAFTADYELRGEKFKLFIMKTASTDQAGALLRRWASLDKERAAADLRPGSLLINDPYNGPVRISWQGEFIWGSLGGGEEVNALLKELAEKLAQ